jgi:hypothetical protein
METGADIYVPQTVNPKGNNGGSGKPETPYEPGGIPFPADNGAPFPLKRVFPQRAGNNHPFEGLGPREAVPDCLLKRGVHKPQYTRRGREVRQIIEFPFRNYPPVGHIYVQTVCPDNKGRGINSDTKKSDY